MPKTSEANARSALVTGGARRVGRHLAHALVSAGWKVVVHATSEARAREAASELGAVGGVGGDLRDPAAPEAIVGAAAQLLGDDALDLLVNNAGTFVNVDYAATTLEQWHTAFDVNARAPMFLLQAAVPLLERRGGMVVNITDHAAHGHWPRYAAHSASKAALESLTLSGAEALRGRVRVNAISPGTVLLPDNADPALAERLATRRQLGNLDQVSDALLELVASPTRTGDIVVLP